MVGENKNQSIKYITCLLYTSVLFPQRIDEDIAENDPVRMVDALVEGLNLESFRKLYKE